MKTLTTIVILLVAAGAQSTALAQRAGGNERRVEAEAEAEASREAARAEAEARQAAAIRQAEARQAAAERTAVAREAVAQRESEVLQAESAELEIARRNLDAARAELERSAQELARLSAERYGQSAYRYLNDGNFTAMRRPLLGLNIGNDEDGVRVVGVSPNGPGQTAGVEIGDLIVSIDGLDVSGSAAGNSSRLFLERLAQVEAGSDVELAIVRDGEPLTLSVETSERDFPVWIGDLAETVNGAMRNVRIAPVAPGRDYRFFGSPAFVTGGWNDMQLVALTPELGEYFGTDEGLLVVRSPADDSVDLRDGDVILQIGERTPQSVGHAMRILGSFEPGEMLEVTIMREQRRRTVELEFPAR